MKLVDPEETVVLVTARRSPRRSDRPLAYRLKPRSTAAGRCLDQLFQLNRTIAIGGPEERVTGESPASCLVSSREDWTLQADLDGEVKRWSVGADARLRRRRWRSLVRACRRP
jgi:hypothetical protein